MMLLWRFSIVLSRDCESCTAELIASIEIDTNATHCTIIDRKSVAICYIQYTYIRFIITIYYDRYMRRANLDQILVTSARYISLLYHIISNVLNLLYFIWSVYKIQNDEDILFSYKYRTHKLHLVVAAKYPHAFVLEKVFCTLFVWDRVCNLCNFADLYAPHFTRIIYAFSIYTPADFVSISNTFFLWNSST